MTTHNFTGGSDFPGIPGKAFLEGELTIKGALPRARRTSDLVDFLRRLEAFLDVADSFTSRDRRIIRAVAKHGTVKGAARDVEVQASYIRNRAKNFRKFVPDFEKKHSP